MPPRCLPKLIFWASWVGLRSDKKEMIGVKSSHRSTYPIYGIFFIQGLGPSLLCYHIFPQEIFVKIDFLGQLVYLNLVQCRQVENNEVLIYPSLQDMFLFTAQTDISQHVDKFQNNKKITKRKSQNCSQFTCKLKKLRYREEHSASFVFTWCTLCIYRKKINRSTANRPSLRNLPRKLPNSTK